jgi:chemotaxis protein CheC
MGKSISLSIPEVAVKATEQIPQYLGDIDSTYMGVLLPILEDLRGTVLFILHEDVGFRLIQMLYGKTGESKTLDEDGESALNEITNIVGSSVINVFAEKSSLSIKPGLPTIVHDYMQSILDSVLVVQNLANDYTIVMDTAFFFEDDRVVGNLLVIPETDTFKNLIDKMRSNGLF